MGDLFKQISLFSLVSEIHGWWKVLEYDGYLRLARFFKPFLVKFA